MRIAVLLLVCAVMVADAEDKKPEKRGVLGLGYGSFGHQEHVQAVTITKEVKVPVPYPVAVPVPQPVIVEKKVPVFIKSHYEGGGASSYSFGGHHFH